jgi:heme/copper-type cytochrome/quinol oxidase subunit 2
MWRQRPMKLVIAAGAILLIFAGSAWLFMRSSDDSGEPPIRVDAIAHEWWWEFDYPKIGPFVFRLPRTTSFIASGCRR